MGQRYHKMGDRKLFFGLACNLYFAKGKELKPKVSKIV